MILIKNERIQAFTIQFHENESFKSYDNYNYSCENMKSYDNYRYKVKESFKRCLKDIVNK